jgi:hypothetical protein
MSTLEPHCGSGSRTVETQLKAVPQIQNGWMLTGISKALEQFRQTVGSGGQVGGHRQPIACTSPQRDADA